MFRFFHHLRRKHPANLSRPTIRSARPEVEELHVRAVPSVTPVEVNDQNQLVIEGTDNADHVLVRQQGTEIQVRFNHSKFQFSAAQINEAQQILNEEMRKEALDFVGPTGTPDDGYKIGFPSAAVATAGPFDQENCRAWSGSVAWGIEYLNVRSARCGFAVILPRPRVTSTARWLCPRRMATSGMNARRCAPWVVAISP